MAENLGKRPLKGILKNSSSVDKPDSPNKKHKVTQWDEMNIIATLHPPDKDYGHMPIHEPKTPYNWEEGDGSGDETDGFDAQLLAEKLRIEGELPPKGCVEISESDEESEEETPERKEQKKVFASKRKAHYNEYYAVKLARKLMEGEEADEDNDIEMLEV